MNFKIISLKAEKGVSEISNQLIEKLKKKDLNDK